jgi:tryptophan synthase alpha chain
LRAIGRALSPPDGDGALVAYIMGGDPTLPVSYRVLEAVVAGGADVIEVGIPFSDPMADGKSIQAAGVRALASGTRPKDVLEMVARLKDAHPVPVAIMTYYNILYSPGLQNFLEDAKTHGVDGLIVPDLPLDETPEYSRLADERGVDTILMAAPTTSPERMRSLVEHSSGFLYLVSLLGVTGARAELKTSTVDLIRFAKRYTRGRIPLGVGFGISTPEQVASVIDAGADAVIVGSAIVNRIAKYERESEDAMLKDVEGYVRSLKEATRKKKGRTGRET